MGAKSRCVVRHQVQICFSPDPRCMLVRMLCLVRWGRWQARQPLRQADKMMFWEIGTCANQLLLVVDLTPLILHNQGRWNRLSHKLHLKPHPAERLPHFRPLRSRTGQGARLCGLMWATAGPLFIGASFPLDLKSDIAMRSLLFSVRSVI